MALAVISVVGYFVIPDPPSRIRAEANGRTLRETIMLLDPFGALVGVTSLVLFNFSWNQAGVIGWSDPSESWYIYLTLILGKLYFCLIRSPRYTDSMTRSPAGTSILLR